PIGDSFCFTSPLWEKCNFHIHKMMTSYRYPDKSFYELLLRVRKAQHTKQDVKLLKSRVTCMYDLDDDTIKGVFVKLISTVFNVGHQYTKFLFDIYDYWKEEMPILPTKLYSTNVKVNELNVKSLRGIEKEEEEF